MGTLHAVEIGELLYKQPWKTWRKEGHVVKTRDHFVLQEQLIFSQLHGRLNEANCLATKENSLGAVISIPPAGTVAGIAILGEGYADTERRYQEVMDVVGSPAKNKEDHPLKI